MPSLWKRGNGPLPADGKPRKKVITVPLAIAFGLCTVMQFVATSTGDGITTEDVYLVNPKDPDPLAKIKVAAFTFITTGVSWTVVAGWGDNNFVECIGGGGGGASVVSGGAADGGGGGGGGYSKSVNLTGITAGGSVTIQVGAGGGSNTAGTDTWFNSAAFPASGQACGAKGGAKGTTAAGGAGGASASGYAIGTGNAKFSGGNGANPNSNIQPGGGGGAGGSHGNGNNGGLSNGGSGDAGFGGASGANGTEWDATHGSGGGGPGAPSGGAGGAGGLYGGGGGGADTALGGAGGAGQNGIIVVTLLKSLVWDTPTPFRHLLVR